MLKNTNQKMYKKFVSTTQKLQTIITTKMIPKDVNNFLSLFSN